MAEATISATPRTKVEAYFPQLDGVRAIAVVLVLVQHWITNPRGMKVPFGFVGVTMFFVLSGYLISRILFQAREQLDEGVTIRASLRTFYMRRFLRIFPIYYLTVLAIYVLEPPARGAIGWLVTYTANFYFMRSGEQVLPGHLWTLAIEEQYYLVYPMMVFLLSAKQRNGALIAMIVVAFVVRFALDRLGVSINDNKYFTLSCFDSFALGGVLAQVEFEKGRERALAIFRRRSTLIAVSVFTIAFLAFGALLGDARSLRVVWFRFVISVPSLYLVGIALLGLKDNPLSRVLASGPVRYIGKISYGIYLYHPYAASIVSLVFPPERLWLPIRLVVFSVTTLAMSSASWFLLEKPIASLKKRFAY